MSLGNEIMEGLKSMWKQPQSLDSDGAPQPPGPRKMQIDNAISDNRPSVPKLLRNSFVFNFSEQLPCRSVEVKFFSVFLCQRCREIWREILVKFSALRFPGFGCATENFTKISRRKRCEKRKISRKFHSAAAQR